MTCCCGQGTIKNNKRWIVTISALTSYDNNIYLVFKMLLCSYRQIGRLQISTVDWVNLIRCVSWLRFICCHRWLGWVNRLVGNELVWFVALIGFACLIGLAELLDSINWLNRLRFGYIGSLVEVVVGLIGEKVWFSLNILLSWICSYIKCVNLILVYLAELCELIGVVGQPMSWLRWLIGLVRLLDLIGWAGLITLGDTMR